MVFKLPLKYFFYFKFLLLRQIEINLCTYIGKIMFVNTIDIKLPEPYITDLAVNGLLSLCNYNCVVTPIQIVPQIYTE
jgi:hypothetical protein